MSPRERILEAAMAVFVRYGYRLTSMERVGQEAGVSRQAVYNHFESKESLFRAVVDGLSRGAHAAAEAAGRAAEASGAPLAKVLSAQLIARWRFFMDHVDGSPHADELMAEHHRQTQDLKQEYDAAETQMLVAAIDRYDARGTRLRPGLTAGDLARMLVFAERGAKHDPRGGEALRDIETIIDLIIRGATEETSRPGP